MSKEIQKAAIKYKYQIFTGFEHGECFKQLENHHKQAEIIQGFVTNDGDFVSRQEAFVIAKNANQLQFQPVTKILMSEDLHIDWLHKQDQKIKELEKALEMACEKLKNLYCSDYCGNLCDDWCATEEDLKQECKLYYKCWNKDCILEQAKEMLKDE